MKFLFKSSKLPLFFCIALLFNNCQQEDAINQYLSKFPENAEIMTQSEFNVLIQNIVFIGINAKESEVSLKSGCEDNGEYWVKTGDSIVSLGGGFYRQITYDKFRGCHNYIGSGLTLIPLSDG